MSILKVKGLSAVQAVNFCKRNNSCVGCKLNFNKGRLNLCIVKNSHEQLNLFLNKYEYEKYMDKEIIVNEKML